MVLLLHETMIEKLIGKGGHAEVYKGCLSNGQLVAVKRLIKKKEKEEEERISDFLSELGIIAHINHRNAARLLGFGIDGGFHLVLQFSPHGSLASVLHGALLYLCYFLLLKKMRKQKGKKLQKKMKHAFII